MAVAFVNAFPTGGGVLSYNQMILYGAIMFCLTKRAGRIEAANALTGPIIGIRVVEKRVLVQRKISGNLPYKGQIAPFIERNVSPYPASTGGRHGMALCGIAYGCTSRLFRRQ